MLELQFFSSGIFSEVLLCLPDLYVLRMRLESFAQTLFALGMCL